MNWHRRSKKTRWLVVGPWVLGLAVMAQAEVLYVDGRSGQDSHPGTQAQPLRTLAQAARRINESNEPSQLTRDMPRGYLHPVPGTLGSDLGAGLFTQP